MKKKILGVGIIIVIGIMLLCLTGCGEKNSSNNNAISMSYLSDEYVLYERNQKIYKNNTWTVVNIML